MLLYEANAPSYPLPPACENTEILRVVIRESFSGDLLRKLVEDIISTWVQCVMAMTDA